MTTTTRLNDVVKTPAFVKITVIALLSLSLFFLFNPFSSSYNPSLIFSSLPLLLSNTTPSSPPLLPTTLHETTTTTSSPPPQPSPSPPPPPPPPKPPKMDMLIRMGIVDKNGAMSTDFEVGKIDEGFNDEELEHEREKEKEKEKERNGGKRVKVKKFKVCEDKSLSNYVPLF